MFMYRYLCVCVCVTVSFMFKVKYNFNYHRTIFKIILLFVNQPRSLLAKDFSLWLKSVYSESST